MLYPPIVASSMPAFVRDDGCNVYFTLSGYNSPSDVKSVHVSVRRPSSNRSVLIQNLNAESNVQFLSLDMLPDPKDSTGTRYYIHLDHNIDAKFSYNQNYKVQLRLSALGAEDESVSNAKVDGFGYSEWSTVCMIRPIRKPVFYIDQINDLQQSNEGYNDLYFYNILADYNLVYRNSDIQGEILRKYRLRLYSNTDELLADSGLLNVSSYNYMQNANSIRQFCSLPYEFVKTDGSASLQTYKLNIYIQTHNGYQAERTITFQSNGVPIPWDTKRVKINTTINEEQSYIKITMENLPAKTNYALRRSDSSSNFHKWEDIWFFQDERDFKDYTVESGTIYRYAVQIIDTRGRRSNPVKSGYVQIEPAAAYLYDGKVQLKLKYDFSVSSYKTNVFESKTDTIGSQHPFIRRNGVPYYRSFGCTGLITAYMDENHEFVKQIDSNSELELDRKESGLYDGFQLLYKNFHQGTIEPYVNCYDYTEERKFREKVEAFLYNSEPKLYKSMQEGNMIIKLMDISLTPKTELGRLIYTFSATAYQIDSCTIDNYNKYGFLNKGAYDKTIQVDPIPFPDPETGQELAVLDATFDRKKDIIGGGGGTYEPNKPNIGEAVGYSEVPYEKEGHMYKNSDFILNHLKITVKSPHRLIKIDNDNHYVYADSSEQSTLPMYGITSKNRNEDRWLGTIIDTNTFGQILITYPHFTYEMYQPDLVIPKSFAMSVPKETDLKIQYSGQLRPQLVDRQLIQKTSKLIAGQIQVQGSNVRDILQRIKKKYSYTYIDSGFEYENELLSIMSLEIETEPNNHIVQVTGFVPMPSVQKDNSGIVIFEDINDLPSIAISSKDGNPIQSLVYYTAVIGRSKYAS